MAGVPLWREHVTDEATAGTPARRSTLAAPGAPAGGSLAGVTYSAEESDGDAWDTSALGRG
jgi:hypothetical protein